MGKNRRYGSYAARQSAAAEKTSVALVARAKKFKAPTQGMEDIYYTQGTSKDAAQFTLVTNDLSNYVGTQSWTSTSTGDKAMQEL